MFDANSPTTAQRRQKSICILHNPHSGKKEAAGGAQALKDAFAKHGLAPKITELDPKRDLTSALQEVVAEGHDTIVAAGGDGTICGVAQALKGSSCAMGILPRGTFNYFARSLGIPEDLEGAVEVIAHGHKRDLRVAMLNDRVFLNNANFGLYPQILRSREEVYDFWGRSRVAAYWSALKVLFRWPRPLELDIVADGQRTTVRTPLVFVFNNAFQLRQMGMEGAECIGDGQLALMIAPDYGRWGMVRSSLAVLLGRASRDRDFHLMCSDSFELHGRRKRLLVARDGERARMKGPFRLHLSEDALQVIVPTDFGDATR